MKEMTEMMIYNLALRVRLYIASKPSDENRVEDLSGREALLLEIIDAKGRMSISEISHYYPKVSSSTISTTVSRLWREKMLVEKKILPENQRITTVSLTERGRNALRQIKKNQTDVLNTVAGSLGVTAESNEFLQQILKNAIGFFDELLDLKFDNSARLHA